MYWGIDPNPVMLDSFWEVTDKKYQDRAIIMPDFEQLPGFEYK